MNTSQLKEKIHSLIDNSDEDTLQSVLQILEATDYSDEFKLILNEEQADYYKNKEIISRNEVDKLVEELLRRK